MLLHEIKERTQQLCAEHRVTYRLWILAVVSWSVLCQPLFLLVKRTWLQDHLLQLEGGVAVQATFLCERDAREIIRNKHRSSIHRKWTTECTRSEHQQGTAHMNALTCKQEYKVSAPQRRCIPACIILLPKMLIMIKECFSLCVWERATYVMALH